MLLLITFLVYSPFQVDGNSMYPTYHSGEFVICQKIFYSEIKRNDVIIFKDISGNVCIKRVAAISGDKVYSVNNTLYINNKPINGCTYISKDETLINHNEYFVIGDNYDKSIDSREYGTIKISDVIGKVV